MTAFGVDVRHEPDGVAWLVLRNPERLNAVRLEMWQVIPPLIRELEADPAVAVVVMRGDGMEAFASGADISEFSTHRKDAASASAYERTTAHAFTALTAFAKPLIAMIHGVCIGGGLALAASADLRIAADDARFALPAARLGLGYHLNGVERLVRLLGPSAAAELFFTARRYDAAEALRIGLVNQVVPKEDLEAFTALRARHRRQRAAHAARREARDPRDATRGDRPRPRRRAATHRRMLRERRLRRGRARVSREACAALPRRLNAMVYAPACAAAPAFNARRSPAPTPSRRCG